MCSLNTGRTSAHMWVGLLNDKFEKCNDKTDCEGKFTWIDGTPADAATTAHFKDVCFSTFFQYTLEYIIHVNYW